MPIIQEIINWERVPPAVVALPAAIHVVRPGPPLTIISETQHPTLLTLKIFV